MQLNKLGTVICSFLYRHGGRFCICVFFMWILLSLHLLWNMTDHYIPTGRYESIVYSPSEPALGYDVSKPISTTTRKYTQSFEDINNEVTTYNCTLCNSSTLLNLHAIRRDDRILKQLKFIPQRQSITSHKTILIYSALELPRDHIGRQVFTRDKCAVDFCSLTSDKRLLSAKKRKIDAVIFRNEPYEISEIVPYKTSDQIWILWLLEAPYHTGDMKQFQGLINWTASYRMDSSLVTPYGKFVSFDDKHLQKTPGRNYARGKTKLVAWFVSNCASMNGRLGYVQELQRHISVDIFGICGPKKCQRERPDQCFNILKRQYKFYLSFENCNCKDYITEKFFVNALKNDVVPVVMGANKEDYETVAPPSSFIHVSDFPSPKHLAQYLHVLDKNDILYNQYFNWKGTGEFINTKYWCRLCAMLHGKTPITWYDDVQKWWRGKGICKKTNWTDNWTFHV